MDRFLTFLNSLERENNSATLESISQGYSVLFEGLDAIHEKYFSDIPKEEFDKIVQADPTSKFPKKKGKYTQWLLNLQRKGNLQIRDLYKATDYLKFYNKYNTKLEQIGTYNSLPELYKAIKPMKDKVESGSTEYESSSEQRRLAKSNSKKVYEDAEWVIVVPLTREAAQYYGKNTQWCTAAEKSHNMFDHYNDDGPLFIVIKRKTQEKFQLHFETSEYRDSTDAIIKNINTIIPENAKSAILEYVIINSENLIDGYRNIIDELNIKDHPVWIAEKVVKSFDGHEYLSFIPKKVKMKMDPNTIIEIIKKSPEMYMFVPTEFSDKHPEIKNQSTEVAKKQLSKSLLSYDDLVGGVAINPDVLALMAFKQSKKELEMGMKRGNMMEVYEQIIPDDIKKRFSKELNDHMNKMYKEANPIPIGRIGLK